MSDTSAIVVRNAPVLPSAGEVQALMLLAEGAAMSGYLSSSAPMSNMNQRKADAFFVMTYGRELGIPPMTALKTIYVIDGKPSCSGQALLALMRRAGIRVELPDPGTVTDRATIRVKRPDGDWREYTYTREMAQRAGLLNRKTWQQYPAEMLIWRAVSTAARFEAGDVVGGLYTVDEVSEGRYELNAEGDLVTPTPVLQATNPSAAWHENPSNIAFLLTRAAERGIGSSEAELLALLGGKTWADFETGKAAWEALNDAFNRRTIVTPFALEQKEQDEVVNENDIPW